MTLVRWEPVRLVNSFFDTSTAAAPATGARRWVPAMDLFETDEHFVLEADLPGLGQEDITLEFEDGVLTLAGERRFERKARRDGFYRLERGIGTFHRTLKLPEGIDPESLSASFDRGVLTVTIPKPEERKPRRVAIQVGDSPKAIEGAEAK